MPSAGDFTGGNDLAVARQLPLRSLGATVFLVVVEGRGDGDVLLSSEDELTEELEDLLLQEPPEEVESCRP